MTLQATFYRLAQHNRVTMAEFSSPRPDVAPRAAIYIKSAAALAQRLQVDGFPKSLEGWDAYKYGDPSDRVFPALYELESYMAQIYGANIFELDGSAQSQFLALDASWKSRAGAYISRIRDIVAAAQMQEPLRAKILSKLTALQSEVDRNQTRVAAFSDMLGTITGAVGRGAKDLEPAVKLAGRFVGALFNAQEDRDQSPPKQLPPPESMGLPEPDDT